MKKYPLSIFNFETLEINKSDVTTTLKLFAVVGFLVVFCEAIASMIVVPAGNLWQYWTPAAGVSFEAFSDLQTKGKYPSILFVGDSTAHSNLDPRVIAGIQKLGFSAWNLASSGNFPLAFQETTLPVLRECQYPPSLLVVSLIPAGFIDRGGAVKSEAGILTAPILHKRSDEGFCLVDFLSLARIKYCLGPLRFKSSGQAKKVMDQRGFAARHSNRIFPQRQVARSPLWEHLSPQRLAVITETASLCKDRGIHLIVSIPPSLEADIRQQPYEELLIFLDELALDFPLLIHDGRLQKNLTRSDFFNKNHLNISGARKVTLAICDMIDRNNLVGEASANESQVSEAVGEAAIRQ